MRNQCRARWAGTRVLIAALLTAAVAGCAAPSRLPVSGPAGGGLNATSDRMILVTIANPGALVLTEPGSTPHGYDAIGSYAVSDQAQAVGAALGRDYGLQQVRAWPIAPLGVQCLVFALPPQADRAALLRRLAADRRVRLAQPLQVFNALGGQAAARLPTPVPRAAAAMPTTFGCPASGSPAL